MLAMEPPHVLALVAHITCLGAWLEHVCSVGWHWGGSKGIVSCEDAAHFWGGNFNKYC